MSLVSKRKENSDSEGEGEGVQIYNRLTQVQKRKRRHVDRSLKQKCKIIQRLTDGEKIVKISLETGIPQTTLSGWKKQAQKILTQVDNGISPKTKRNRDSLMPDVSLGLLKWMRDARARKEESAIDTMMMIEKANK